MLKINLYNIEELILQDKKIHSLLPDFIHLFTQWRLSKTLNLRTQTRQISLNLLNSLEESHVQILKDYFGMDVEIASIETHIVKHIDENIEDVECKLSEVDGYNLVLFRKENQLYISAWR